MDHFGSHVFRIAALVVIAPDRFGAPVAAERTTARGGHVEAEIAVPLSPEPLIARHVDQVPGRQAAQARVRRLCATMHVCCSSWADGDTCNAREPGVCIDDGIFFDARHQFEQWCDAFADQHRMRAGSQKHIRVVGCIGAGDQHAAAGRARLRNHLAGRLAHAAQAHLGEEVEVVLVEHHQIRLRLLQGTGVVLHIVGQHRVEQAQRMAALAQ